MTGIINCFLHLVAIFISNLAYDFCFAKLIDYKLYFNKRNVLIMILFSFIMFLNNTYNNNEIKTFFSFLIVCANLKLLFNSKLKEVVIGYILYFLTLILLEILVTNVLSFTRVLNNSSGSETLTYIKISLSIVIGMIEYLIFCIPIINKLLKKLFYFFIQNTNAINISYLIFFAVALIGMLNVQNFASTNSIKLILSIIILFAILFVFIIKLKFHEEILKVSNRKLIDYNDNYGKFLDEYKIYKHNINHKLSAMKTFGNKKINALIDDLLEEENTFSIRNNNIYNVPNGIKGIVAEKLYNKKFDVIINNNIENDPFIKLHSKIFNSVSECVGVVLDNAIEASEETKNPVVIMDLYEDAENIYVKVGNSYNNHIDLSKLGNKYYSTKNRGSGLGLFSIMRNKLIKEKINIINDFYSIELQIKKAC